MTLKGVLYGIGIGPGDAGLITVKACRIIRGCLHVFVPRVRDGAENPLLTTVGDLIGPETQVREIFFPASFGFDEDDPRWDESADALDLVLAQGSDACLLVVGHPLLYSAYHHLLVTLRRRVPDLEVVTVPGITPIGAASAAANFPLGRRREPIIIVPVSDDLEVVRRALSFGGTLALINIGKRLGGLLDILENAGALGRAAFISGAGTSSERVETDLRNLRGHETEFGNRSVIFIRTKPEDTSTRGIASQRTIDTLDR